MLLHQPCAIHAAVRHAGFLLVTIALRPSHALPSLAAAGTTFSKEGRCSSSCCTLDIMRSCWAAAAACWRCLASRRQLAALVVAVLLVSKVPSAQSCERLRYFVTTAVAFCKL